MRVWMVVATVAALLLGGCQRDEAQSAPGGISSVTPERELELRTKLFLASNPTAGSAGAAQLRATFERTQNRHFAEQKVLLRIAAENNVDADADEVAAKLRPLEAAMAKLADAEKAEVAVLGKTEVICDKVRDALFDDFYENVTEEEIGKVAKWGDDLSVAAAATNELVRTRAAEVWRKLADGGDFATLAQEYSEAAEAPDCDWGEFTLAELDDSPELCKALEKMQPGEFSSPVEGDNGLMIARLASIDLDAMPPKYNLERIFFRLAEEVPAYSKDEIRAAIANKLVNEFISREIENL